MFSSEYSEREVANAVRGLFRANIPESNAWAQPSQLSVFASVFGALAHSALTEARNGIDQRVMVDTAAGDYLDAIAARPPYNTTRLPATKATGCIDVTFAGVASVITGETFTSISGQSYIALADVDLDANGSGQVKVEAVQSGSVGNAVYGTPINDARGDAAVCLTGIGAGHDVECDDDLRDRLYSYQPGCQFGSLRSIEICALGVQGVKYAKACEGLGGIVVYVGTKTGPVPTQVDIDEVQAVFDDPCKKLAGICVKVLGIKACPLELVISEACRGVSIAEMTDYLTLWIAENAVPGLDLTAYEVERILGRNWPAVDWVVLNGPFSTGVNCVFTSATVTQ